MYQTLDDQFNVSDAIGVVGFAASGKTSCIFKSVKILRERYNLDIDAFDTGKLYRLVTAIFLEKGVDLNNENACVEIIKSVVISSELIPDGEGFDQKMIVDGIDYSDKLHTSIVDENVPKVARLMNIRKEMEIIQYKLADKKKIFMIGRDIGTTVFCKSRLNIFLATSLEIRAKRRLLQKGLEITEKSVNELMLQLAIRDDADLNRAFAPLRIPDNSVRVGNDGSQEETISEIVRLVGERFGNFRNLSK